MDVVGLCVCAYEGRENRFRAVGILLKTFFFPHKISSNLGGRATCGSHTNRTTHSTTQSTLLHSPKPLYVCSTLKGLPNDMRLVAVRGRMGI